MNDDPVDPAQSKPFDGVGAEQGVRGLVDRFYDLMDLEPGYADLRALHPTRLDGSRDKLYMFLSGWLGGPQLYTDKFGHPMLRARHLPFAIGIAERDAWIACMRQALESTVNDEKLRVWLLEQLYKTADWMRNKGG